MVKKISKDTPENVNLSLPLKQLDSIFGSLDKLANCPRLPVKLMYWLGHTVAEGRKHLQLAADTQKKMVREYNTHPPCSVCGGTGKVKGTGEGAEEVSCSSCGGKGVVEADFMVPNDKKAEFMEKMETLMSTEVSLTVPKIPVEALMDKADSEKCIVDGFNSSDFANLNGVVIESI